jgi:hypothetical protein
MLSKSMIDVIFKNITMVRILATELLNTIFIVVFLNDKISP